MKTSRYEVYVDLIGGWRWRLVAKNGEIVGQGESYTSEKDARRGIRAHRWAALTLRVVKV